VKSWKFLHVRPSTRQTLWSFENDDKVTASYSIASGPIAEKLLAPSQPQVLERDVTCIDASRINSRFLSYEASSIRLFFNVLSATIRFINLKSLIKEPFLSKLYIFLAVMAQSCYGQIKPIRSNPFKHPVCQLSVAHRMFNVDCALGIWRCTQSTCPRSRWTFFLFFILDIFVRIAESNYLHARRNTRLNMILLDLLAKPLKDY
jgi:hypothetical protein